jgi:hypothetical protein
MLREICFAADGKYKIDGLILTKVEYVNGVMHQVGMRRGSNIAILLPDLQSG